MVECVLRNICPKNYDALLNTFQGQISKNKKLCSFFSRCGLLGFKLRAQQFLDNQFHLIEESFVENNITRIFLVGSWIVHRTYMLLTAIFHTYLWSYARVKFRSTTVCFILKGSNRFNLLPEIIWYRWSKNLLQSRKYSRHNQHNLDNISNWCHQNDLKSNWSKRFVFYFYRKINTVY